MKKLLSTKEVSKFLSVNEKMVYTLVSEKGLPATKITGKWVFPLHLVEQWVEANTINYPEPSTKLPPYQGLLIIAGSNDPFLDRAISLYNRTFTEHVAVFGNVGSMGGLKALRRNLCHMASSHLISEDEKEYNFDFATKELEKMPVVVNFCRREQGIIVKKGNPKKIKCVADLTGKGIRIANRSLGTGTRLLFDRELKKAGIKGENLDGYHNELSRHLDAGIEVMSGKTDAAPAIRAVAITLGLDFIPLRWERFDLLIPKDRFFDKGVQLFIGMFHEKAFKQLAIANTGYDLKVSGKIIYPGNE